MEAEPFLAALEAPEEAPFPIELRFGAPGGFEQSFHLGRIDGVPVLVVVSGIGLANAASATSRALVLVDTPIVIAAGTCGGVARDVNVGNIAVGVLATYGAADATAFGYALGQVPGMPSEYATSVSTVAQVEALSGLLDDPLCRGRVVSSDVFVTASEAKQLRERFPDVLSVDMETCALAQVAWSAGVDWVSLRAVSDLCGPDAGQDFHVDGVHAARCSARVVRVFLKGRVVSQ